MRKRNEKKEELETSGGIGIGYSNAGSYTGSIYKRRTSRGIWDGSLSESRAADTDGFEIEDGVLKKYTGTATEVVIPEGVTSIGNQAYHVKGYSPREKTLEIPSYSKIEKTNMLSAMTNHGTCRFMCYEENMTQQLFINFMERLVGDAGRKVLFIVDNLKVHHGKIEQE